MLRCAELDDYWGSSKDRVNRGVVEPAWYEIHDENSIECGDHMWHYDATPIAGLWIGTITERVHTQLRFSRDIIDMITKVL